MTTKTNVKLKGTILQLAFRWLLPPFCFGISAGSAKNRVERDGRASKIGRRLIQHPGITLPILAALPLAQTNRLLECWGILQRYHSAYLR